MRGWSVFLLNDSWLFRAIYITSILLILHLLFLHYVCSSRIALQINLELTSRVKRNLCQFLIFESVLWAWRWLIAQYRYVQLIWKIILARLSRNVCILHIFELWSLLLRYCSCVFKWCACIMNILWLAVTEILYCTLLITFIGRLSVEKVAWWPWSF